MLSLTDAAALSVWPGVRRARLAEFLHAIAAPACTPAAPAAGSSPSDCGFPFSPTLEAALDFAGASNVGSLAVTLHENGDRALALAARGGVGAIVSELAPGTPPRSLHFPARNRIISGLSLATVVVEAAERSGSLITADFAIEQGREALAVPGSILSGRYRGCHALIRDGAGLVEDVDDVLAVLPADAIRSLAGQPEGTSEGGQLLGLMLEGEPYGVDLLARQSGLPAPALLSRLLELELQGKVRRVDGSRFVRVGRTC